MKKIAMTHHLPLDRFTGLLEDFEIIRPAEPLAMFTREEALEAVREADALITIADFVCDRELIDAGKNLKAVGNLGSGFNNVDVAHATQKGIVVLNTPTAVMEPTAEMTIALMLGICRSTVLYDRNLRRERVCKPSLLLERDMMVSGKTLGVLGFGRIGRCVAKKAHALGMHIIYSDMFRASPEVERELDARMMDADEVISNADVITLHVPYLPENHHYMDERRIGLMKPTAYLINASRGQIVKQSALLDALKNRKIRGAALDVHEFEPDISPEIAELDNIVLTPHACTNIAEVRLNMLEELLTGVLALRRGERPANVVNASLFEK